MIEVFRISKSTYIHDLTGIGAKLYGGRWNRKGVPVLYTAASRALAVLEYLVHLPVASFPLSHSIATIQLPNNKIKSLNINDLPEGWNDYVAPESVKLLIDDWIKSDFLVLQVPSVIVPKEHNYLINPLHPDFHQVVIQETAPYQIDDRFLKAS